MQQTLNQNVQRSVESDVAIEYAQPNNACQAMLMDLIGPSFNPDVTEDITNPAAQELYQILKASEQEFDLVLRMATQSYLRWPYC